MVYFSMKRARDEGDAMVDDHAITTMANCLMLLSRGSSPPFEEEASSPSRVFECKTCNRQFPSFQALGGHRASHKKPRLGMGLEGHQAQLQSLAAVVKPKTHECSICGLEFAIGQALGGHMRRHRAALIEQNHAKDSSVHVVDMRKVLTPSSPVVKKANSRRVFSLDLNLTPLENDHLEFGLGKNMAYAVDLY